MLPERGFISPYGLPPAATTRATVPVLTTKYAVSPSFFKRVANSPDFASNGIFLTLFNNSYLGASGSTTTAYFFASPSFTIRGET